MTTKKLIAGGGLADARTRGDYAAFIRRRNELINRLMKKVDRIARWCDSYIRESRTVALAKAQADLAKAMAELDAATLESWDGPQQQGHGEAEKVSTITEK